MQTAWAFARGEGAAADGATARMQSGPGPRGVLAGVMVVAVLLGGIFWVATRGSGDTWVEATSVAIVDDGDAVTVDLALPAGCWVLDDTTGALVVGSQIQLDVLVVAGDEAVSDGCLDGSAVTIPLVGDAAALTDEVLVDQAACASLTCGDPVVATRTQ